MGIGDRRAFKTKDNAAAWKTLHLRKLGSLPELPYNAQGDWCTGGQGMMVAGPQSLDFIVQAKDALQGCSTDERL